MTERRSKLKKRIYKPNSSQCEGCPDWDDVNGCWDNVKNVDNCTKLNDEGYYPLDEEDEEDGDIQCLN